MNSIVSQIAGTVVPVPVDGAMKAISVEGKLGDGTRPEVVVDSSWDRLVGFEPDIAPHLTVPDLHHVHLTELSRVHIVDEFLSVGPAASLSADLDDPVVLSGCFDHQPTFPQVVGDGLLDVDVLACLAGQDGCGCMPMKRGRDDDAVDLLIVQDPPDVLFQFGTFSLTFLGDLHRRLDYVLVHVAEVLQVHIRHLAEVLNEGFAATPDTHNGQGHLVVGRYARPTGTRCCNTGGCTCQAGF